MHWDHWQVSKLLLQIKKFNNFFGSFFTRRRDLSHDSSSDFDNYSASDQFGEHNMGWFLKKYISDEFCYYYQWIHHRNHGCWHERLSAKVCSLHELSDRPEMDH